MPQEEEGVGVTLGAQVRHLVTYREPPEDTLIYTGLPKSVKNGAKRGYPLFLTGFLNAHINGSHFRLGGSSRPNLPSDFGYEAKTTSGRVLACTPPK